MIDITSRIEGIVRESGVDSGICTVFIPHTTACVTINENADPDVVRDFTKEINKLVPWEDGYLHAEGNSAAHLKSSMIGFSEQLIIDQGRPRARNLARCVPGRIRRSEDAQRVRENYALTGRV
jgi:secondary thiamine-phosphate synthase enzyme